MSGSARPFVAVIVLCLLLFGVLIGAVSETSQGNSSLKVGPASDALTVALTLAGAVVVASVILAIWTLAQRQGGSDQSSFGRKKSSWLTRIFTFIALGLFLAVLDLFPRIRAHPRTIKGHTAIVGSGRPSVSQVGFRASAALATVAVLAALVLIGILSARYKKLARRRRLATAGWLDRDPDAPLDDTGFAETLADSLASVRIADPNDEPDPRKAIVAAYLAMVHAAGQAGAIRQPDVTPSEYLELLLNALGVSVSAAGRLTALFERARYSTMPCDESLRSSAIDALQQVRDEIGPLATTPAGSGTGAVAVAERP